MEPGVSAEREHHPHRTAAGPDAHSPHRRQVVRTVGRRLGRGHSRRERHRPARRGARSRTSPRTGESSSAFSTTSTARTATRASRGRGSMRRRSQLTDVTVIFRALPVMPSKRLGAKTGGRIVIDPDGNLLMTLGDRSDSPPWDVAQKLDNHLGKIIRVTPDGAYRRRQSVHRQAGRAARDLGVRHAQPGRARLRSENRPSVAERPRSARRRRAEHRRKRQELRLAGGRARHRLSGRRRSASRGKTAWKSRSTTGIP